MATMVPLPGSDKPSASVKQFIELAVNIPEQLPSLYFPECDIAQIKSDIMARDKQDMEREIAPLCKAEDAILVDSSDMSIPQVIDTIISEFKKIK